MKNAILLISVLVSAMLTSCAGVNPTRIIGNTVAAAGGAFIGKKLGNGNSLITTAAAGGGVLLGDGMFTRKSPAFSTCQAANRS